MKKKSFQMLLFTLLTFIYIDQSIIAQNCGTERWNIKTLSDKDTIKIDFNKIIKSTVKEQVNLDSPRTKRSRLESETFVYSIECYIIGFKKESNDKDIHIVIKDFETNDTMIVEIPSYECYEIQKTSRYELFKELDEWFINNIGKPSTKFKRLSKPIRVTITGVGFFDFIHGQTGVAKNGREIHPVLSMKIN